MNVKQLIQISDFARKNFLKLSNGLRLEGMTRDLIHSELIAISYYQAVITLLISEKLLINGDKFDIQFLTSDSHPNEDDYL